MLSSEPEEFLQDELIYQPVIAVLYEADQKEYHSRDDERQRQDKHEYEHCMDTAHEYAHYGRERTRLCGELLGIFFQRAVKIVDEKILKKD